jgi:hypothetical protein
MARSKEATKKAKAAYTKRYRKEHPEKVKAYNRKTVDERAARNAARAEYKKKYGVAAVKGKEVHHVNSNPKDNKSSNTRLVKKNHGGGVKGNQNARKKRRVRVI